MKTKDAIQEFLGSRGGLAEGSRAVYRRCLAPFQEAFDDLPEQHEPIQEWLNRSGNLSPPTVYLRFAVVRALYNHVYLPRPDLPNPIRRVRPPRLRPMAMRTFNDDELYALFNLRLMARDRALLTLFLDTGMRRGEAASLTWGRVAPEYLVVSGKGGERVVPISDATFRLLEALRGASSITGQQDAVFQGRRGPLTAHGIYEVVRHLCERAGVTGRRASPHTFRSTFATLYASEGACDPQALQRILGHRDFATTLRYINASRRHIVENHRICTPLRGLEALAQGRLIREKEEAVREAEEILTQKGEGWPTKGARSQGS